jgi:hypothetical protein
MSKECLDAVFDLIKVKAKRMYLWKGKTKTKVNRVHLNSKYIKVTTRRCN